MKRDTAAFGGRTFDVAVIGGGIYGACAAWHAVRRGLSAALIDRDDFGARTSANNLKIVHGGLRYLQQADIVRMRQSITERRTLLTLAPDLVEPLPSVLPTSGLGGKGRPALAIAMLLNDLISSDRNRGVPEKNVLPDGKTVSAEECRRLIPGVRDEGLTGAAVWHDAIMPSPFRLTLAFVMSAVQYKAVAANYVEAMDVTRDNGKVSGIEAVDRLTGRSVRIKARTVLNAAGPWAQRVMFGAGANHPVPLTKAFNIVLRRKLPPDAAAAVYAPGGPVLFIVPWRGISIVGTAHLPHRGGPDDSAPTRDELRGFIDELNRAYPGARVSMDDISYVNHGLLPGTPDPRHPDRARIWRHYKTIDHAGDGFDGLISVVSVKYTTARQVTEEAVELAAKKLGWTTFPPPPPVLPSPSSHLAGSTTAGVRTAVREEMACRLGDVVFRRLEIGGKGEPSEKDLSEAAGAMAAEWGWTPERRAQEIEECRRFYRRDAAA